MESRATLFGHSIHQMLVSFPLGVLAMPLGAHLDAPSSLGGPVPAREATRRS